MSTPTIEVRGLSKTYPGGVEAVQAIDFDVEPGEVFGLLGPNGAGKSTTIGMLTTTVRPTGGRARLAGHDVASEPLAARAKSSVVFQEQVLDRALSARRNLEIHARLWGVERLEAPGRIGELAKALGIDELLERPVGTLSGGRAYLKPSRIRLSAKERGGEYFLEIIAKELSPLKKCDLAITSRIVETDRNAREINARIIFQGRGHRECGE